MPLSLGAYQEAVQHPQAAFADPALQLSRPELDALGLPRPRSGNMAVVFRLQGEGGDWAVRCLRRLAPGQGERYAAIAAHLAAHPLPYFVPFAFQARGIRIDGAWQTIVKMAWAEGERLDAYVARHLQDRRRLEALARAWLRMLADLERAGFAHGDLQHGNVLVDDGALRLVDYDGMFVPALAGRAAPELGHPNYQHPGRTAIDYAPWLDRFSGRVVHLSLQALALRPELWQEHSGGDECLLLRRRDFLDPQAGVWLRLDALGAREISARARELREAALGPPPAVPPLQAAADPVPAQAAARVPRVPARLPVRVRMVPPRTAQGAATTGASPAPLAPGAEAWLGGAAAWLLPDVSDTPVVEALPAPLDRLLAGIWLAGLVLAFGFAIAFGGAALRPALPWTAGEACWVAWRFRGHNFVRARRRLRRAALQERRKAAQARAALGEAQQILDVTRQRTKEARAQAREQEAHLDEALAAELKALRRDLLPQQFTERIAALRQATDAAKARRLAQLRAEAERRALDGHRVLDDPGLAIRRGARQALHAAGVVSAWDLMSVRDRLVLTRDGRRHYVEAIGPERAERVTAWHEAALRAARAGLPDRLPPDEARRLQAALQAELRALRQERHEAMQRFLAAWRAAREEGTRRRLALHAGAAPVERALAADEERLRADVYRHAAVLREARFRQAALERDLACYREVRVGRYLVCLLSPPVPAARAPGPRSRS